MFHLLEYVLVVLSLNLCFIWGLYPGHCFLYGAHIYMCVAFPFV